MSIPKVNPNETAKYPTVTPSTISKTWRKFIIQASTPNDMILNLTAEQRNKIARIYQNTYDFPSFDKPNTNGYTNNTDLTFSSVISPQFDVYVEKVKVCLHKEATYGCVKLNVWNYGNVGTSEGVVPTNLVGIEGSEPSNINVPLSIYAGNKLISNALNDDDEYMKLIEENTKLNPLELGTYVAPVSLLRFGIQYADSNAYGLKVFLVCWANVCDFLGDRPELPDEGTTEPPASGIPPDIECQPYQNYDPSLVNPLDPSFDP